MTPLDLIISVVQRPLLRGLEVLSVTVSLINFPFCSLIISQMVQHVPLCLLQAVDSKVLKIVKSCFEHALEVSHSSENITEINCFQLCCLLTICTVYTKQNKEVHVLWICSLPSNFFKQVNFIYECFDKAM
jgi:hypothetical protein